MHLGVLALHLLDDRPGSSCSIFLVVSTRWSRCGPRHGGRRLGAAQVLGGGRGGAGGTRQAEEQRPHHSGRGTESCGASFHLFLMRCAGRVCHPPRIRTPPGVGTAPHPTHSVVRGSAARRSPVLGGSGPCRFPCDPRPTSGRSTDVVRGRSGRACGCRRLAVGGAGRGAGLDLARRQPCGKDRPRPGLLVQLVLGLPASDHLRLIHRTCACRGRRPRASATSRRLDLRALGGRTTFGGVSTSGWRSSLAVPAGS